MNCAAFERRLERYQAGTLPETERRETDQHLYHCPACRGLLETLQLSERHIGEVDLSQAVLSRTSGSTCRRCRVLLGDLLDGQLDAVGSELVLSHLGSCRTCGSLFRVMSEMTEVLPQMQEVTPDPSFLPDVLRSIRALRRDGSGLSRVLDFFRGLAQRPRFSWEAAYLGALLVFGLFGTPFSPVHDASSRFLATLQNPEGLVTQADSTLKGWCEEARIAIGASERAKQVVGQMTTRSFETAQLLIKQGRNCMEQSEEYLASARKALQTRVKAAHQQTKESKAPGKR